MLNAVFPRCSKCVNCYVIQVIIVTNHMNGKDTHVRGLRVLGPVEYVSLLTPPCCSS
jgi:hypothetical protein